jgi:hypothetical protein
MQTRTISQEDSGYLGEIEAALKVIKAQEERLLRVSESSEALLRNMAQGVVNVAKTKGIKDRTTLGTAVVVATASAAVHAYQTHQEQRLQKQREEYALNNLSQWEAYGNRLYQEVEKALVCFNTLDTEHLQSLQPEQFGIYLQSLARRQRYQESIVELHQATCRFVTYYGEIARWGGHIPDRRWRTPPLAFDEWINRRLAVALEQTRRSASLLYNYSVQGHLLLQMTFPVTGAARTALNSLTMAACERLNSDLQQMRALHIYYARDYLLQVETLHLGGDVSKALARHAKQIRRDVWFHEHRSMIILIVTLVVVLPIVLLTTICMLLGYGVSLFF